jgi:hypothetical protein
MAARGLKQVLAVAPAEAGQATDQPLVKAIDKTLSPSPSQVPGYVTRERNDRKPKLIGCSQPDGRHRVTPHPRHGRCHEGGWWYGRDRQPADPSP